MLSLHTLRLQGYATFKDVTFNITPGVTYVYGLNRASGKASKNRNGVGKSALLGAIPEIVHEEPIIGERADRAQGQKTLGYRDNKGREVEINRVPKGRGEKIVMTVDGKDLALRTSTIAKQAIRRSFPLTPSDYQTYVHIDSRIPHPLVMGSSADRQRFFTRFFGLDKIDAERKLYVAELAKLKRTRAAFDELRVQYQKARENLLTEEQIKKYTRLANKYAQQVSDLQDRISQVQNILRLIEFAQNSKDEIAALKVACQGEISLEEFERADKDSRIDLEDAEKKLEDATAWEQYQHDNQAYNDAWAKMSPKAQQTYKKLGRQEMVARGRKLADRIASHQQKFSEAEKWVHTLKQRLLRELPKKVEPVTEDRDELETLRRAYRHQLEHAQKFKQGQCETCGQVVKIKDPKVLRQKLEAVIEKLNRHEARAKYEEAYEQRKTDRADYEKWRTEKAEYSEALDEFRPRLKVYREVLDLPQEPKPFKGQRLQVKVCQLMVEELKDRRSLLKFMRPHLETVIEFMNLSKEDLQRARAAQGLEEEMSTAQEKWTKAKTVLSVHETFKDQVGEMRARLVELKKELADEEPLKHLVKAYQNKNLKKMAIEAISERLMVLVNRFAQQVMPERFTFEFKWDTQIRLLVHRHHGKKVKTSDVRRLSGAESTFFTLVLVCALLAFVPDSKRVNVLILDEPAARLSDELKETFKHLIKTLNTLIPSIVVITPHQEVYDGARCVTVVKDRNGNSTLVEAHPQQIK